jgi:phosphotransferase system HPr-like phosphotransfer protein
MNAETDPRFHAPSAEEQAARTAHVTNEVKSMMELITLRQLHDAAIAFQAAEIDDVMDAIRAFEKAIADANVYRVR